MPVKSFEPVYKRLNELFINELPAYIEKENKEHNDGIILKEFENKYIEENCILLPSFVFAMEDSEYSEKDRILENTVFCIRIEVKLQQNIESKNLVFWRYVEAVNKMISETEDWQEARITQIKGNKIYIKIII